MKGKFWLFIFVLFTLIMTIAPTTMAIPENDLSISGISLSQNGNKLAVGGGIVKDSIDPRYEVNITINVQNPLVQNYSRISLYIDKANQFYIDKGNQDDIPLWEELYSGDFSLTESRVAVFADITLNDTSIKRIRIRISQNTSDNETVSDPDLLNNVMILEISKISVEEDLRDFAWYLALIALIPLVVVFTGILVFKLSSRYVAPAAMIITMILALFFFKEELGFGGALKKMGGTIGYSALWGGLDYVYAIFGAFFFLKMLEKVGAIDQLKNDFKAISTDKQHQVLLIGFCFALILAAVAPGGSNFVIAAIMLVSLGFNRIGVGVLCLFGNSISSVFGLLGVSIIALKEVTGLALLPMSGWIGIYMIVLCIFAPLIMNIVYTEQGPLADFRDPDLKEDIILLMGMGAVYGTLQALVAWFAGPELPTIIAGGATLVFVILYERYVVERNLLKKVETHVSTKRKKTTTDSSSKPHTGLLSRPYFYAMGLMVFLLLVTRLVPWVKDFLTMDILTLKVAFSSISADKVMKFAPFYSPGTILFVSTLTVPFFVKLAAKYFPESEMESSFIEDLTPDEIMPVEEAEIEVMKGMVGLSKEKDSGEGRKAKEKSASKKISTNLTEEMKKTAEKIKSAKIKGGEKEARGKKSETAEPGKGLKKKKKKKKKKPKITSKTDTDMKEGADDANSNDDKHEEETGTSTGRSSNREKRRHSIEARRNKRRKVMNDGGEYEVEFDDDDDDDLDWDESDDDDDLNMEFDDDDYDDDLDDDFFQDSDDDSGEEKDEDVQKVRIDVLAHAIQPRKMINRALLNTAKDVAPILLAIVAFIAMANIMRYFNMTSSIAINIVKLVGDAYVFFIPIIGMSGSALTGSTTTSNVLFGGLHIEAATRLGLPTIKVAAAQVLGSSAGEMISPMNAVVIATAIGLKNKESILIKRLLPTFAFWLLLCTIISVVFVSL